MATPLDYEPRQPRERTSDFWIVFLVAGLMTAIVLSSVLNHVLRSVFLYVFPVGIVITAVSLSWAKWTGSIVVAVCAGILGPPAVAILIMRLVAAFS